ncbi:MAG: hypothetical protein AB1297_07300 [bacterium]
MNVRDGNVNVEPGYDGVYGKIEIFKKRRRRRKNLPKPASFRRK